MVELEVATLERLVHDVELPLDAVILFTVKSAVLTFSKVFP